MKKFTVKELSNRILLLHNRVIEIKGSSIFNEENTAVNQPQSRRPQNAKIREK